MSKYVNAEELDRQGWMAARSMNWEPMGLRDSFKLETEVRPLTDFPAADVREIKHGRWTTERTIEHDGEMYCDQCGWTWENLTFDRTKVKKSPFCPNCGSRMDLEGDIE